MRSWSVETMSRKLVHGVEFDLMRRGIALEDKSSKKMPPLPKSRVGQEFKEFLPKWPHR